ncbi:ABC transporter substrate-binding protein [Tianweitania sediminis]|uniref:ABC transporter substrate-binding protein n=1 Tax=Tianweitania sediminis TaxID=1502156 RepID=A0A8J7UIZ8_9HYPH|nr:ABC transporter substrate-binding protein [Tianweitania sediminis]MBP0438330.1 ABC transporter substrate-binding protein [Tianweitania sediminis]
MRIRKFSLRFAASILALSGAMAPNAAFAEPDAGEYKIGFISEATGPLAAAGNSYLHGAQLAIEQINAEESAGKGVELELVEKESGSDAARSVQALTQFIADRDVLAVSCCILSPVAGAVKPVAIAQKMPLVLYGATRPGLPELPYVTSIVVLPGPQEVKMTKMLAEKLAPKTVTYFVNADNDGFQGRFKAAQEVMEEAGIKTGGVVSILSADTDFTAPATQAIATNPDLIMVWTTQTPAAGIIAALRARGYEGHISASDVISPAPVFERIGEPLAGIPFPTSFAAEISTSPEAKAFAEAYEAKFNGSPDTYAAQGYTAMRYIAQGLKSLDGEPTREALANAMASIAEITPNVYGGLPMKEGQADVDKALIAAWTKDGKITTWEGN